MREHLAEITIPPGAGLLCDSADSGERQLDRIYDAYARALYRYALAITSSADDAEDAVQEVFVRVAREWKRVMRVENHKAYLFSATRNAAYTILRSRRRRDVLTQAVCLDMLTGESGESGNLGESRAVCEALANLPVDQREVLVLKVYDQMSFKEIAKTVGISQATAASRYRYAIEKLRKAMEVTDDE